MNLESAREELSANTKDFWTPRNVPHVSEPINSMTFLREYVSQSSPVVINNGMRQWKCMRLWSLKYLSTVLNEDLISVNVTPDGRADAIKPYINDGVATRVFVAPEERKMSMQQLCEYLEDSESKLDGIAYLSKQNDNLNEEFSSLLLDVPPSVSFAREAFGTGDPEAVNLWIGDSRSVSSCHQDFYENIYCVIRGVKIFTLYPPSDAAFLKEKPFRKGTHRYESSTCGDGTWHVDIEEDGAVNWIDEDATDAMASPVVVEVKAGEMIYIPAMWYHSVAQRGITIAVNYWHDMQFGHMFVMSKFIRSLHAQPTPTMESVVTRELLEQITYETNKDSELIIEKEVAIEEDG